MYPLLLCVSSSLLTIEFRNRMLSLTFLQHCVPIWAQNVGLPSPGLSSLDCHPNHQHNYHHYLLPSLCCPHSYPHFYHYLFLLPPLPPSLQLPLLRAPPLLLPPSLFPLLILTSKMMSPLMKNNKSCIIVQGNTLSQKLNC
jgi:hypothetical protein